MLTLQVLCSRLASLGFTCSHTETPEYVSAQAQRKAADQPELVCMVIRVPARTEDARALRRELAYAELLRRVR